MNTFTFGVHPLLFSVKTITPSLLQPFPALHELVIHMDNESRKLHILRSPSQLRSLHDIAPSPILQDHIFSCNLQARGSAGY